MEEVSYSEISQIIELEHHSSAINNGVVSSSVHCSPTTIKNKQYQRINKGKMCSNKSNMVPTSDNKLTVIDSLLDIDE